MDFRTAINLIERAQDPTQATQEASPFERWFAGSKVVDGQGKPLKLFHGTSKDGDFKSFKMPKNGVWFTTDPKAASEYAEQNDSQGHTYSGGRFIPTHTASRVIPCYVKITNPMIWDEMPEVLRYADNYKRAQALHFDQLRSQGYDGIIFASAGTVVVLGDPTQIKSAVGNTKFDPNKKGLHEDDVAKDLEHFGHEPNFNIRKGDHDDELDPNDNDIDGPALFPSGGQWFICTDWSCYVRRELGDRAKLYGFDVDEKRSANELDPEDYKTLHDTGFDGHDFAVVDDRYIVDGWLKNIEGFHHSAVLDMQDPKSAKFIQSIYGNPKHWDRNHSLEARIDRETPEMRAQAFRGVKRFGQQS